jgi:CubicO group peptidase (beta-lactamase class C family)
VPTKDGVAITAKHLALHSSGLPRLPPSLLARKTPPDPFAGYTDDLLFQDLIGTQLAIAPGKQIGVSYFGTGLLGFVLGRKIGGGFATALATRVLGPLELRDTFITPPPGVAARRVIGTDDDLKPASRWTWGALAGAGGVITSARDLLKLVDVELDAAAGSKGTLRPAMRLTQETQLDSTGDNVGLGWMIDAAGRVVHEGTSGGFRAYVGLDPKTRRGVVVLASTQSPLVDLLGLAMFEVLDGTAKPPTAAPKPADLAKLAGKYNFGGTELALVANGNRIYLEGPGEPRHRLVPFGDHTFWIEALQAAAKVEVDGDKVKGVIFKVGGKQIAAPRIE